MAAVLVRSHWPAHRDDRGERAPVGQLLPIAELDPLEAQSACEQLVLIRRRRLARDMLQDEERRAYRHALAS
jgi:hypothetical protein